MNRDFFLLGGDRRQYYLARLLQAQSQVMGVPGLPDSLPEEAPYIVLPCPAFTPAGEITGGVAFARLEPYLRPGVTVFAGRPGRRLAGYPVQVVDLLADEIAAAENARLTAEGALTLAAAHREESYLGSVCLVTGFGRIAKPLALLLQALGAQVTVAARSPGQRAMAESLGLQAIAPTQPLPGAKLVFNTVPAQMLGDIALAQLPKDCLWVELASAPGGLPADTALHRLDGGSLPGRMLPLSAAQVLYRAILRQRESMAREG